MGVGVPQQFWLQEFGDVARRAFGEVAYHVGSSLFHKEWRDVDVRVIISDDDWDAAGYGDPARVHQNSKWVAMCLAFSALGRQMTGLPIDFQLQRRTEANREFTSGRSALFSIWRTATETKERHIDTHPDGGRRERDGR